MRKFISISLCLALVFCMTSVAFAGEDNTKAVKNKGDIENFVNAAIDELNESEIIVSTNYFSKEVPFEYNGKVYTVYIEDRANNKLLSSNLNKNLKDIIKVQDGERTCTAKFKADSLLGGTLKLVTTYKVYDGGKKLKFISASAEMDPPLGYSNGGTYTGGKANPINSQVDSYGKYTLTLGGTISVPVKLKVNTTICIYDTGKLQIEHSR